MDPKKSALNVEIRVGSNGFSQKYFFFLTSRKISKSFKGGI
jgi:hypothetical protein